MKFTLKIKKILNHASMGFLVFSLHIFCYYQVHRGYFDHLRIINYYLNGKFCWRVEGARYIFTVSLKASPCHLPVGIVCVSNGGAI